MWKALLNLFGGNLVKTVSEELGEAYQAKLKAETNEKKLEAQIQIAFLEGRMNVLLAEQKRWLTAWIRPALAAPVVILLWKLIVWDTVLGWGVTPDPGDFIRWVVVTVVGAYFLTRPFERK